MPRKKGSRAILGVKKFFDSSKRSEKNPDQKNGKTSNFQHFWKDTWPDNWANKSTY